MRTGIFAVALWCVAPAAAESGPVSFSREIAPILVAKCINCHGADAAKGGYRVHTFEALGQSGNSSVPALTPRAPAESELFKRLITADEDDRMPQKDDPLSFEQVELFRRWIASGAALDRGEVQTPIAGLIPREPHPAPPEEYARPVPVLALAFNPAGTELAAGGYHEVTVWSPCGELLKRISDVPQRVRSIAFHPERNWITIAGGRPGRSGEVSLYDISSGELIRSLVKAADEMLTVSFSAEGTLLAAGGSDNAIHIFDTASLTRISTIQQHADWVTSLAFNASGSRVASGSRDRTARVYDARSGALETTYTAHTAQVLAVSFVFDELIISAGRDRTMQLWSFDEGKKKNEIGGFTPDIHDLIVANGQIFSAAADGKVRQHAVSDRKLVREYDLGGDAAFALAFDPVHETLASGAYSGRITLWNTREGSIIHTFVAAPGSCPESLSARTE